MKKILIILSAAILSIGLLASCGKYESELHSLDERVKTLENEKIANINQQIAKINASIEQLSSMRGELDKVIKELETAGKDASDAKKACENLDKRINELKAYVDGELSKYATQSYVDENFGKTAWIKASFATLEEFEKTCEQLAALENTVRNLGLDVDDIFNQLDDIDDSLETLDSNIKTLKNNLLDEIDKAKISIQGWVTAQLGSYYTIAQAEIDLGKLQGQIDLLSDNQEADEIKIKTLRDSVKLLDAKIASTKTEIEAAYKKAISDAISANNGYITDAIKNKFGSIDNTLTTIENDLGDTKKSVAALQKLVEALKGRIQSVVFVPEYSDGKAYITKDGQSFRDLVVSFKINPADRAKVLTVDSLSIGVKDVIVTKAAETVLKASKVENNAGVITVTVAAATINGNAAVTSVLNSKTKELVICLNIKTKLEDLSSDYILVGVKEYKAVNSVSFETVPSNIYMGQTLDFSALVKVLAKDNQPATNQELIWNSSDESVATVDANGIVTPKKKGDFRITATSVENKDKKATTSKISVMATSITLDKTSETLYDQKKTGFDNEATIHLTKDPANLEIVCSVDRDDILKVEGPDMRGNIKVSVKDGASVSANTPVTLTVASKDYKDLKATCVITVKHYAPVKSLAPNPDCSTEAKAVSLQLVQKGFDVSCTYEISFTFNPTNPSCKDVTLVSAKEKKGGSYKNDYKDISFDGKVITFRDRKARELMVTFAAKNETDVKTVCYFKLLAPED